MDPSPQILWWIFTVLSVHDNHLACNWDLSNCPSKSKLSTCALIKYTNSAYCIFLQMRVCLPSCIEVRAWLTVCWLERRQFFSWAVAVCGEEAGLMLLTEFAVVTSGVEGRDEEGPGEPGDEEPPLLLATWLHTLPPPPPTGLDKHEPRVVPTPNGALQQTHQIRIMMFHCIYQTWYDYAFWFYSLL